MFQSLVRRRQVPTRLTGETLEARWAQTVNVATFDGSLAITGTPDSVNSNILSVAYIGNDMYRVTDDGVDIGQYHVTKDLRVNLQQPADFLNVDIAIGDDVLNGNISVDVDNAAYSFVSISAFDQLTGTYTSARIGGNVSFSGGVGNGFFALGNLFESGQIVVGGDVRATGAPVTEPLEDSLWLYGAQVHGNVTTSRITYTNLQSSHVDGDLVARATDSPCGLGLTLNSSSVAGDVSATGGATVPFCFSATTVAFSTIGGDFKLKLTDGGSSQRFFQSTIQGSAVLDLAGDATTTSVVNFAANVLGDLVIRSTSGTTSVQFGFRLGPRQRVGTVSGDVVVQLGNGTNTLMFNGEMGSQIGGTLNYHGGTGADSLTINGRNNFRLVAKTGGGDDTVAFTPTARVGSALIDFGKAPGTKKLIRPDVVDFVLQALHL